MPGDSGRGRLILRRYEANIVYHAAFTYWNLRGVIAEKWGHGPHFAAWADQGAQITLTPEAGDTTRAAIVGIHVSGLAWDRPDTRDEARSLAVRWLTDCLTVLNPKVVNRIIVRQQWIVPTDHVDRVNGELAKLFVGTAEIVPPGYEHVNVGANFNARKRRGTDHEFRTMATFGSYYPDMAPGFFQVPAVIDQRPAVGAFIECHDLMTNPSVGFVSPTKALTEALDEADTAADDIVARTLRKVLHRA